MCAAAVYVLRSRWNEMLEPEPEPEPHRYALLTTGGLEHVLAEALRTELGLQAPAVIVSVPPPVRLCAGFGAGKAGATSPVLVQAAQPLDAPALSHPCVSAPLALALRVELEPAQLQSAAQIAALLLTEGHWDRAAASWRHHHGAGAPGTSFRVATLRGGAKHTFSSRQLDAALGAVISDTLQPSWTVELKQPSVLVLCLVLNNTLLIGLLLPPFRSRGSSKLPNEPLSHSLAGSDRPHMRPSRAASLVRLAKLQPNEVFLDPCGGIGVLPIEAARFAPGCQALSLDIDPAACRAANANALAASGLVGSVCTLCSDALRPGLRARSVDVVVVDLPFGLQHKRMDVRALLQVWLVSNLCSSFDV
jgi:cytochrome-b5 reductase